MSILEKLEYEIYKDKFKYRPEERTPSAKVSPSGRIVDFIMKDSDMSLKEAIDLQKNI